MREADTTLAGFLAKLNPQHEPAESIAALRTDSPAAGGFLRRIDCIANLAHFESGWWTNGGFAEEHFL